MTILLSPWVIATRSSTAGPGEFALKAGRNTAGRNPENDICIPDDTVSGLHAEIHYDAATGEVSIRDLESTNGTYVNRERVFEPHSLRENDTIRLGQCVLTLTPRESAAPPAPRPKLDTQPLTRNLILESLDRHAMLLYEAAIKLNNVLDTAEALQEVASLMQASMGADKCVVLLAGQFDKLHEMELPSSIARRAIQEKAAIIIPKMDTDSRLSWGRTAMLLRIRSALCVPVIHDDEVLALVYMYKNNPLSRPFDQRDLSVAVAISHQAALTLHRMILIKRSAAALQASEYRFRGVVSNSPDIIYSVDAATCRPMLLNRDGLLDYSKEEFEAGDARVFAAHPDDLEAVLEHWARLLFLDAGDRHGSSIEYRLCHRDGGRFEWVQSRETILEYDPDGTPKQVLVQLTLITERKEAQDKLRRSELMLAHAQKLARLGYWEWEMPRNVVIGSDEFYRLYGADPHAGGMTLDQLEKRVHPADRARSRHIVRRAAFSGQSFSFDHRLVLPDGTIATHQVNGWAQLDSAGKPLRLFGTAQDVTEPKQAERAIKRRSDELAMMNSVVTAINGSLDLNTILVSALEQMATLYAVDGAECFLYGQNARLKFAAQYGLDEPFVAASLNLQEPAGRGLNRLALSTCQPVYLPDLAAAGIFVRREAARAAGYRCALCVPIMGHKLQLGTFTLYSREARAFGPETLNVLTTVSAQMGVAIERTYLYDIQRQRTAQLTRSSALITALSRVAGRLRTTANPDRVMRTLGAELHFLDVICFVFVLDHHSESLILRYNSIDEASLSQIQALIEQEMDGLRVPRESFPIYNDLAKRRQVLFLPDMVSLTLTLFPGRPRKVIDQIVALAGVPHSAPLVYLPLAVEEHLIGVLAMVGPGLQESDISAFSAFADQVAVAIENARLFEEVSASREQLRQLARQVVSAQEDERRRVSRELHDEAGQALTALKISLQLIHNELAPEQGDARRKLRDAVTLTDSTMQEIRLLAQTLRPPSIDAVGSISPILDSYCREFGRRTGLTISYVGAELPRLPEEANLGLYRLLQEALTNVARHARAKRAWVVLSRDSDMITLSVEDDGKGFSYDAGNKSGIGLLGMQERIRLLGGQLAIESQPQAGARLVAYLPCPAGPVDTQEQT